MAQRLLWYFASINSLVDTTPIFRALVVCVCLYQIDLVLIMGWWLAHKASLISSNFRLEPENRKDVVVVLPTLLRKREELDGLLVAIRSVVQNNYPGRLYLIACIDGQNDAPALFKELSTWVRVEPVPPRVSLHAVATLERCGKAVAMDYGIEYLQGLVSRGKVAKFPEVFFNMDADSTLGSRVLERMVYRLTRRRWLSRRPYYIVTSNVTVPSDQYWRGFRSLFSYKDWIARSVALEYLGAISAGKFNWKLIPGMEVSGALYCTWSQIYLHAPRYASFLQSLRLVDWFKWWVGWSPPSYSAFSGLANPEALTGPGDDTWMGWFACCITERNGLLTPEFPRTPVHAFARTLLSYVSRPVSYDPLAKVYSKTPTTVNALFKQRLRWNSSRIQDLFRWRHSLVYSWEAGLPLLFSTAITFAAITLFAATPLVWMGIIGPAHTAPTVLAFGILAILGYYISRLAGTVVGLIVSDSWSKQWITLLALPIAVPYHVIFNTLTLLIGYYRDIFGFGEPTTFAPERTLLRSNLSRLALAYRLRRAFLLAIRAIVWGDVPLGTFWFGWRKTKFTSSGFEGWSSGKVPPPVLWPARDRLTKNPSEHF